MGCTLTTHVKKHFLTIKRNMSKAYEKVEYPFVQRLLLKMGFSMDWAALMMQCISPVTYKVFLNRQPKGHIFPEKGLRQGDSLSPYLFILCTEALIVNIQKEDREKKVNMFKNSAGNPYISHLLFTDDSLFFCKVTIEEWGGGGGWSS